MSKVPGPPASYTRLVSSTTSAPPSLTKGHVASIISQAASGGAARDRLTNQPPRNGKPDYRHSLIQAFDGHELLSVSPASIKHFLEAMDLVIAELASPRAVSYEIVSDLVTHRQFPRVALAHIETGDPTSALVPLRLTALLLSRQQDDAPMFDTSLFHNSMLAAEGIVEELGALIRAQDPLLTGPSVLILHALSVGPCRGRAAGVFAELGNSFIWLVRRLFVTASHRESATHIIRCLLSAKEGIRLCQTNRDVIDEIVLSAASLRSDWNSVKNWNV